MIRRSAAPGRGADSPSGQELLGAFTSHGPFRGCYWSSRKSRGSAEAMSAPAADPAVSAERLRAASSSAASTAAVLQRGVPPGGAALVALEGAEGLPCDGGRQAETQRPKPALPGAGAVPELPGERGSWGGREGNHSQLFSSSAATGLAAMRDSCASAVVSCSASAHRPAGRLWSGSNSGSGAGGRRAT